MSTDTKPAPEAHHYPLTDRRAFLATAPALAVLTAGPAMAAVASKTDCAAWDSAMQSYASAVEAYQKYDTTIWTPLYRREVAFERAHGLGAPGPGWCDRRIALIESHGDAHCVPDHVHDELERLANVEHDAEIVLMNMPAPHHSALAWKLDRIFELDDDGMQPWTGKYVRQTIADYRRLLGEA